MHTRRFESFCKTKESLRASSASFDRRRWLYGALLRTLPKVFTPPAYSHLHVCTCCAQTRRFTTHYASIHGRSERHGIGFRNPPSSCTMEAKWMISGNYGGWTGALIHLLLSAGQPSATPPPHEPLRGTLLCWKERWWKELHFPEISF